MAWGWLSRELVQRTLTPSTMLPAGIVSLIGLVVVTAVDAANGHQLDPHHWMGLWVAGFVVIIIGTALIRLPMLLRDQRDERESAA
jgi:peptidoglycan/LPS O-acetylase OafA/YrhL